jgi:hypothetical protein
MFSVIPIFRAAAGCLLLCRLASAAETPPLEATNLWVFRLSSGGARSTPAIAPDGTFYAGSFNGTFYAITPDGQKKWAFKAGAEIISAPAIAPDGTVYFGSRDRHFYAVTPTGQLKWGFTTGAWVDSSPAIAVDGTIYFGGWDKTFYALNPDGSVKWKLAVGAIVDSSPAIAADGTIYFGAHNKNFYALNPDGTVRWTFLTGGVVISSPAIGRDGMVYFSSLDGNLYALKPDGTEQWRYHTDGATDASPVLDENENLYLPANHCTISVSKTGQRRGIQANDWPAEVSPAVVAGQIYVSTPWLRLSGMTEDFAVVWRAPLFANSGTSLMVDDQGIVYVASDINFFAIRPPGELRPPAKSSWPMFRANVQHTGRVGNP